MTTTGRSSGRTGREGPARAVVSEEPTVEETVAHESGAVWCSNRSAQATISVVERRAGTKSIRYVQWCSLIGIDVDCDESCVSCLAGTLSDGREEYHH